MCTKSSEFFTWCRELQNIVPAGPLDIRHNCRQGLQSCWRWTWPSSLPCLFYGGHRAWAGPKLFSDVSKQRGLRDEQRHFEHIENKPSATRNVSRLTWTNSKDPFVGKVTTHNRSVQLSTHSSKKSHYSEGTQPTSVAFLSQNQNNRLSTERSRHLSSAIWTSKHRMYVAVPASVGRYTVNSFIVFLMGWDWVRLVLRPLFGLLYQPQMIDDDDCGAIGGMRIGKGNWSTRRTPALVPLCLPQIPHDLTLARTGAAAVESRRLTAWDSLFTELLFFLDFSIFRYSRD
jgi:hypothetical protein